METLTQWKWWYKQRVNTAQPPCKPLCVPQQVKHRPATNPDNSIAGCLPKRAGNGYLNKNLYINVVGYIIHHRQKVQKCPSMN